MKKYKYYLSDETGAWDDLDTILKKAKIKGKLRRIANPFDADIVVAILNAVLNPSNKEFYRLSWKIQFLKLITQYNPKALVSFSFEPAENFTGELKVLSNFPKYLYQKESAEALAECLTFYLTLADLVRGKQGLISQPKPLPELTLEHYMDVIEGQIWRFKTMKPELIPPLDKKATPTFIKLAQEGDGI